MRQTWTTLILVALLLSVGCGRSRKVESWTDGEDDRIEVEVLQLRRSQITKTLEAVGTLLPVQATTIVSEVDGVIEYLPKSHRVIEYEEDGEKKSFPLSLDIGTLVAEGEVLVKLNPTDCQLSLEQANASRDLAQKKIADLLAWRRSEEIQQLEAELQRAQSVSRLADADLQRNEQLLSRNAASAGEHDALLATARQAHAAVAAAEAALALAKAGPTAEQRAVALAELESAGVEVRRCERELEKTVICCPYPAVVTDRFVGVGDRVTAMPRVEIMQIADPRMLFAEVDVPERYLGRVQLDDVVKVKAAGTKQPVFGKIELMGGRIDMETRTFRVRIGIDNRAGRLKPGGFVRAWLPIESGTDALVVPRPAVSFTEGQPAVFVFQADEAGGDEALGRVTRRGIELGIVNRAQCEITAGVRAGELVVLTNPALLADGLPVRVIPAGPRSVQLSQAGSSREVPP